MIFGIDLGTTNSLIAWVKDGVPTPIANVHGSVLTPSVISVDVDGSLLVGATARERLVTHPSKHASSIDCTGATQSTDSNPIASCEVEHRSAMPCRSVPA